MSRYPFRMYYGGEVLLFAAAPWSLYAMRWAANKPPILCFAISLLSAALLFFAKLTGLVVFATNVVAISLLALVNQRRLNSSTIAMWVASAIAALCFMMFWVARGPVPAGGSTFSFSWFPIWFSVAGAAFSGISGLEFLVLVSRAPWMRIIFDFRWRPSNCLAMCLDHSGCCSWCGCGFDFVIRATGTWPFCC